MRVRPGDEHDGRNALADVHRVVARAVVLVDHVIERIAAAVFRDDRQAEIVTVGPEADSLAVGVAHELDEALRHVVEVGGEGVGGPVNDPEAPVGAQPQAVHVEVQVADHGGGDFRVRVEVGGGPADLGHPEKMNGPLGLGQLALIHQRDVGASGFQGEGAA